MDLAFVKKELRDNIALRADKRAQELIYLRNVAHRKHFHRTSDFVVDCIFTFQVFLIGAFVSALWYA
jgi:hypothetical protein